MGGKLILTTGLIGLCHAAYSATQHRNYLRLIENEFTQLPSDILIQTVVSLLLCCYGIISLSTKFKPIQITSEWENKTWDNIANRTSFYSFNHRGKYLFSDLSTYDSIAADISASEFNYKQTRSSPQQSQSAQQPQLTEKEKKERQNALIRQRLAEAHRDDKDTSSSLSTSEEEEETGADEESTEE